MGSRNHMLTFRPKQKGYYPRFSKTKTCVTSTVRSPKKAEVDSKAEREGQHFQKQVMSSLTVYKRGPGL
jgi:hypothetical protein